MMDLNLVVMVGRLVRDSEKKSRPSGASVLTFDIANGYRRKSGETWSDDTNYFTVVVFGKSADALFPYMKKGRQVAVEGALRQNRWEINGENKSKVVILATSVNLLAAPKGEKTPDVRGPQPPTGPEEPHPPTGSYDFDDDEPLPF